MGAATSSAQAATRPRRALSITRLLAVTFVAVAVVGTVIQVAVWRSARGTQNAMLQIVARSVDVPLAFQTLATQDVERFTGSAQADWRPIPWLSGRATLGLDVTQRVDRDMQRFHEGPPFLAFDSGYVDDNRWRIFSWTANVATTASFQLTPALSSKTSAGVQYFHDRFNGTTTFGQFLPPGGETVTSGSNRDATDTTAESVTLGSYVEEVVGLHDRLFFTGAVRIDRNSAVGKNLGSLVYPKAAVSWLVSDEPFFPQVSALSRLRLRAAYGASGLQPGVNDAIRYFQRVTAAADGGDQAVVNLVSGGVGNPDLKP